MSKYLVLLVPALFQSFLKIGTRFLQCNQGVTSVFRVLFQCSSHFWVWGDSWSFSQFKEAFLRVHSIEPQISPRTCLYPKNTGTLEQALYIYIFITILLLYFNNLAFKKKPNSVPVNWNNAGTTGTKNSPCVS